MVNRRRFLRISGGAAASAMLLPRYSLASRAAASKVYVAHDEALVEGNNSVSYTRVKKALNSLAAAMTGRANGPEAWENVFAGVTTDSTIAIKVNCLHHFNSPQWDTLKALVECLTSMCGGQFPASNIYVFDNDWKDGVQRVNLSYSSGELDALGVWHGNCDYNGPVIKIGSESWRVMTKLGEADFGISFGVYRPHCCNSGNLTAGSYAMSLATSTGRRVTRRIMVAR